MPKYQTIFCPNYYVYIFLALNLVYPHVTLAKLHWRCTFFFLHARYCFISKLVSGKCSIVLCMINISDPLHRYKVIIESCQELFIETNTVNKCYSSGKVTDNPFNYSTDFGYLVESKHRCSENFLFRTRNATLLNVHSLIFFLKNT